MLNVIKLTSNNVFDEVIELQLNTGNNRYKSEDILSASKMVYEDKAYSFEVDEDLSNYALVQLFFNKEEIKIQYMGNKIQIKEKRPSDYTFKGYLGFLQIRLFLVDFDGEEYSYYSEYASIMVKSESSKRKNIEAMLQYVYDNQKDLLYTSANAMNSGNQFGERFEDFGSEIVFLEELADVYEKNTGYFRANSRFKLEQMDVVDSIYKMQHVNEKTIRHMVQHPDLLREDAVGIKVRRQTFLPEKALMPQNMITKDIYENQVVVGFLKKIVYDIKILGDKISEYISATETRNISEEGYVSSSSIIFSNLMEVLKGYRGKIISLRDRFLKLISVYSYILPVKEYDCSSQPKPSPIFLSVPQYNQIYTAIHKWYQKTGYDFSSEQVMLQLMDVPSIYEAYVLVKLIRLILSKGYTNEANAKITYHNISKRFTRKECNNTFIFKKDDKYITLYYEPVVYNSDSAYNDINIYRNNSVSFSWASRENFRDDTEEGTKHYSDKENNTYYVPDYLLKISENGKEKYLIMDAKYSAMNKVRNILSPELVYKYIFSLSPVNDDVEIIGLNIFSGIYFYSDSMQSLYDNDKWHKIKPVVELIPLSEEMKFDEQEKYLEVVWKEIS